MKGLIASAKALGHKDYGASYSEEKTQFRVWAPTAYKVKLALYENWQSLYRETKDMTPSGDGSWVFTAEGNLHGRHYNYLIQMPDSEHWYEVLDPYAKASAPNSRRGMVVNLKDTDPAGFREMDELPLIHPLKSVIYELHLRDFTVSANSGAVHKGKYLGLAESETQFHDFKTGLDHLVELGVTHVHIMPVSDYATVDELNPVEYNWGYDPIQFNVPEGSYATDPIGISRIVELKQMIMALHAKGLRVVLDVVYNHTYLNDSNFSRLAPNYYYRMRGGKQTDGSGCGNELNFSKPMVQKFLLDSLKFWMDEYRIDGFRFDLMGLYDVETIDMLTKALRRTNPTFLIYGEPWTGGHSGLQHKKMFLKGAQQGKDIAVFNDEFRNAVKGDNDGYGKGIVLGVGQLLPEIKKGIAGEINYSKQISGFALEPHEVVQYICAHDNLILRDKIEKVTEGSDEAWRIKVNRLAFAMMIFSFGTPFIHEGTEFYRTKYHDHNSYASPDHINAVDWSLKERYYELFAYIKDMIQFRQEIGLFNQTAEDIRKNLKFQNVDGLGYTIMYEEHTYCFYHNFYDVPVKRQIPKNATIYFLNDCHLPDGSCSETRRMVDVEAKGILVYRVECK